ncbi:MAG: hypothetical protein K0S39_5312 [Paenibacillus sp.]|nr:hypothetical protein [Paenibacillus sp.]
MIHIANKTYEVVVDHKNGWKPDAFKERYSEVLERYDYIVGDWGYNQLRLRGFFKDTHPKATKESSIATLQDYLNEYCNFGCAYFIIERIPSKHQPADQKQGGPEDSSYEQDEEQAELELQQEQPQPQQPRPQRHQEQQSNRQQRPQHRKPHHNHQSKHPNQQSQQNQQNTASGKGVKPS